jgi:hypothetical protein
LLQTAAALWANLLHQVQATRARVIPDEQTQEALVSGTGDNDAWRSLRRPLRRLTILFFVLGSLIAGVVFVGVPRGQLAGAMGSMAVPIRGRITGLAESVDLRLGGTISESGAAVLEAELTAANRAGIVGGEGLPQYLRARVLDDYDGGRWVSMVAREDGWRTYRTQTGIVDLASIGSSAMVLRISPRSQAWGEHQPVLTLWRPAQADFHGATEVRFDPESGVIRQTYAKDRQYTVVCVQTPTRERLPERGSVSFKVAGVRDMAGEILRRGGFEPDPLRRDPEEDSRVVRVLESYLTANYAYALDTPPPPIARDPTEYFLTTGKAGHCEYFASALAGMCRSVGIPARVVAGYLANEFDPSTGRYTVRARDAHAWVEAMVAPGVWRTLDATPVATGGFRAARRDNLLSWLGTVVGDARAMWDSSVVSFDFQDQLKLFGLDPSRRSAVRRGVARAIEKLQRLRQGNPDAAQTRPVGWRRTSTTVAWGLLAAGLCSAAAWALRRWWTRRGTNEEPSNPGWAWRGCDRAVGGLVRELTQLAKSRAPDRAPGETLGAWLTRAFAREPKALEVVLEALSLAESARFGGNEHGPALAAARERIGTVLNARTTGAG